MQIEIFGVIVVVMGVVALNLRYHWAFFGLAICSLFAGASTIAFPALGGLAILPANLFMIFFVLRAFNLGGGAGMMRALSPGTPGFWLAAVCVCAAVGSLFLPRALAGTTFVYAINRGAVDPNQGAMAPLGPVSGNLSQVVYLIGNMVLYCCMSFYLTRKDGHQWFAKTMLFLAALNVIAAVVDLAGYAVGFDVLAPVKTADFAMHGDEELGGLKRICGTFVEASAFAGFTLPLFAFTANLWLLGYRPKLTGLVSVVTGGLLLASTSGTAYVGFTLYMALLLLSRSERISPQSRARKRRLVTFVVCAGVMGAIVLVLFKPSVLTAVSDFFGETVMKKADSDSGVERGAWNMQAIQNFIDTYGLGIGLGSSRASSFALVLLSNLGLIGTVCFGMFVARASFTPISVNRPYVDRVVCYAARQGMLGVLIVASIAGTVFELGPCFYLFAAAAASLAVCGPQRLAAPARGRMPPTSPRSPTPSMGPAPARAGRGYPRRAADSQDDVTEVEVVKLVETPRHRVPAWPIKP